MQLLSPLKTWRSMHHAKRGGVIQRSIKDTFSGGDHDRDHSVRHRKCADRRLLARGELSVRWADLSLRQSAVGGPRQTTAARSLGHDARLELHLRPSQPADQEARPRHDLYHRIYITGPGHGGPGVVANAYLEGTYS